MSAVASSTNGVSFAEFASWTGAKCEGPLPGSFSRVTFDSRRVTPGCLYMAFPGATRDGHEFVAQALEKTACADCALFVGPEGDFTPDELAALVAVAVPTSFGETILRAETAAIYGLSVLTAALDAAHAKGANTR